MYAQSDSQNRTASLQAYCFTSGFKHKMTYYLRPIPNIGDLLQKLDEFIPTITGGIKCSTVERNLL